jgi:hypothetical protein
VVSAPNRFIAIIFWLIFIPLYYFRINRNKSLIWFICFVAILILQSYRGFLYDFGLAIIVLVPLIILAMQQFASLAISHREFSDIKIGLGAFTVNITAFIYLP